MKPYIPNPKNRTLVPMILLLVATALNLTIPSPKAADSTTGQRIPFPDERLTVSGLAWFSEDKPALRRLPARLKESFRPSVWSLAQQPSGGRIRFATDSRTIAVAARNPDTSNMHHMTRVGQSGLDLYVNGRYLNSAWPDKDGWISREWTVGADRVFREITLYLPLYKGIALEEIVIEPGSSLRPAPPFAQIRPVVYYGSSITQGGCAENPGLSYQAIVSRRLNVDFINLGFSGNGLGDPDVAVAIAEIDASCFVLDYWANPSPEVYHQTMPGFVQTLRAKHPLTPILITGPYYFPAEAVAPKIKARQEEKRTIARDFVKARRAAGDLVIAYVDGFEMLSPDQVEGLVDGVHANSIGFYFCANGLEPHLRRALNLPSSR